MNNKDYHILNWDLITNNTYKDNKEINKGVLFEDLIERLLFAVFPFDTWKRTSYSYDGKKDFVSPADEFLPEEKWSECKNYNENISINVISPTLIMGNIENIKELYFFSYSKLNDNAIDGIIQFSANSNKKAVVFDGNLLENLICKYHKENEIDKFFPNTNFNNAYSILKNKAFRVISFLKDSKGNHISSSHIFQLGEPFELNVIVQNLSLNKIDYKIRIINKKNDNAVIFKGIPTKDTVLFAELKENIISGHSIKAGDISFEISISSGQKIHTISKRIHVCNEQYLFWTGERAYRAYDNCISHLQSFSNNPLIITAKSGAGKSTLLNYIFDSKDIVEKYSLITVNIDLARSFCTKSLFCQILKIYETEDTPLEQTDEQNRVFSILMDNYAKSANMIAKNIMSFYNNKKPFLFIIDDVQRITRSYIELIFELNDISKKTGKQIYYIFSLNTDYLSINDFLIRMNWDKNYGNNNFEKAELFYFNNSEISSFLKHKFGLTDIDKYFKGYNKEISPLEVQSFSTDLKNKHIITQIPGETIYRIVDKLKFEENVDKILYQNYSINEICATYEGSDILEFIIKYICINSEMALTENNNYVFAVNQLIQGRILKEENGKVFFCHDKIKDYIKNKVVFLDEDYVDLFYNDGVGLEGKVICALNEIGRIIEAPSFLKSFFECDKECKRIGDLYDICWKIFEHLKTINEYKLTQESLNYVYRNLKVLSYNLSQEAYLRLISYIFSVIKSNEWVINSNNFETISYFIKKYLDRQLSTYNHEKCINDYNDICKMFSKTNRIPDDRKNYWLSHYSNRAAISLDRNSDPFLDEPYAVKKLYDFSESYCAQSSQKEELLLQICVDNFYRKYVYHPSLTTELIISQAKKLNDLNQEKINRKTCLKFHKYLFKYLEMLLNETLNEDELKQIIVEIDEIRNNDNSSFYILKLFILKIYILITLNDYIEAYATVIEALEFAYLKGRRTTIYKLTYIKAFLISFLKNKNEQNYYANIILAFEQFMNTKGSSINSIKRESYLLYELLSVINSFSLDYFENYIVENDVILNDLLRKINNKSKEKQLYNNHSSYYIFNGINFPLI